MKEIVIVSPFQSMTSVAREVIRSGRFSNVDILEAEPENIIELTQNALGSGARVAISRGGFYEIICARIDMPVVEVKVTAFDLIDVFKLIQQSGDTGPISVIGHRNVIYGADIVAGVMGLKAECFQTTDKSEIEKRVASQIKRGIRIFVGDNNVKSLAERPGCKVFLVHSGEQAMLTALQQAGDILHASRLQKERAQQFAAIIDFVHDGIVAVDNQGKIKVFNHAAEKIIGFPRSDAIGKEITEIIPETRILDILESPHPDTGQIKRLDERTVVVSNRVPVVVDNEIRGAVLTYQAISEVQNLEHKIRVRLSEKGFAAQYEFVHIIHTSRVISECIHSAKKFSRVDASILFLGDSGVGKELFAQAIHNESRRRNFPFVAINCAVLPEALIESELFGYVEGSFTGAARKGKAGLFEMAHGGTIFLDEINELPVTLQNRLLRVLQERQVMRLGDDKLIPIDIRVICASNRDLRDMVDQNTFRSDLYFRIAILNLYIPPLNERVEDIDFLSAHFLKVFSERYRKEVVELSEAALEFIRHYEFKGNVRELRGMIERAVIVCEGKTIRVEDLHGMPYRRKQEIPSLPRSLPSLKQMEDRYIDHVIQAVGGSVKEAGAILEVSRTTLWRHLREKGEDQPER